MRAAILAAVTTIAAIGSPAFAASGAEGEWQMADGAARIQIAPCAGQADRLCGTITDIKPRPAGQPPRQTRDGSPPRDPRSMIGQMILVGLKPDGEGKWTGGRFQFPGSDRTIKASMALKPDGALRVNGCVMLVCGGQDWRRP